VLVAEDEGRIVGSVACGLKDAIVGGEPRRVSYEMQVFTDPERRRAGVARALLEALGDEARARGAVLSYMIVIRGNTPMERVIASMGYLRHRQVSAAGLLVFGTPARPEGVREARASDAGAIADLLARTWKDHELWTPFSEERVAALIAGVPHHRPLLVLDRGGIVACAGVYDVTEVTRVEVVALSRQLDAIGRVLDAGRRLMALPRVPQPGEVVTSWVLTPLGFDQPRDLRPLLDAISAEASAAGINALAVLRENGHPIGRAWWRRVDSPVHFGLHWRPLQPGIALGPARVALPGEDL
jgi:hypothetical protein